MRHIYFDHNATTPLDPAVLEAMLPFLGSEPGNPSSVHGFGQRARAAVERARGEVAALIGARPAEIIFTSGGTEADNTAVFGLFGGSPGGSLGGSFGGVLPPGEPGHIVTTAIEHPAVLAACAALAKRGIEITCVPVGSDGVVNPEDVRRALRPETRLVSVMHANNELGTIQPVAPRFARSVETIGKIAAEAGVLFHCDAVQSAGKLPIDVNEMGVHLLSLSAHKFGGPKGAGALFVRRGVSLEPLLHGGHSERERRAGTENVAGIVGMGRAASLVAERLAGERFGDDTARIAALRDRLERGLLDRIPGARVNGSSAPRVSNTTSVIFPGVDSEALIIALDLAGLACSAGAACSAGVVDASHVLIAIGLSPAEARSSVRLSLGRTNTEEEIDLALDLIPAAVARQGQLSGAGKQSDRELAARP